MSTKAEKRRANIAAAKQRRAMVTAGILLAVFAVLLVIQGPKLLDALGGSAEPSAALPASPDVAASPGESSSRGRALRFNGIGSDPFASRSLADNDPQARAVSGPAGARDPFANGSTSSVVSSSPASAPEAEELLVPQQIVVGTPTPGVVAKRGWIVVLASIQTRAGRVYADRFAARVRSNGLEGISVLDSSNRKPLRSGYFVVYTGPFKTLSDVQRSADHVHAFGYRTAYVREILRY